MKRSKWTKKEERTLLACIRKNPKNLKHACEDAAQKLNRTRFACYVRFNHLIKLDKNKRLADIVKNKNTNSRLRGSYNKKETIEIFRKYTKLYAGNLYGEAFPRIAKELGISKSTVRARYYGSKGVTPCCRNNLYSFFLLSSFSKFNGKNFNRDKAKKITFFTFKKAIKAIFSKFTEMLNNT